MLPDDEARRFLRARFLKDDLPEPLADIHGCLYRVRADVAAPMNYVPPKCAACGRPFEGERELVRSPEALGWPEPVPLLNPAALGDLVLRAGVWRPVDHTAEDLAICLGSILEDVARGLAPALAEGREVVGDHFVGNKKV